MSIGGIKRFDELNAGEWVLAPGSKGVEVGFIAKFRDGQRLILVSNETARCINNHGIYGVYVPEGIEIQPDTLSLTNGNSHSFGHLVCASNGMFLHFSLLDYHGYANIHSGIVEDPDYDRLRFTRWSLLEKQIGGYVPLLEFGLKSP